MKTRLTAIAAALGLAAASAPASEIIGFWDFDDGFSVANETVQIIHSASIGGGTIYQQRADTDGNGKGGVSFSQGGFDGTPTSINSPADRAMAWDDVAKSGDNDAEFFVVFDTTGYQNIMIRFDIEGNGDSGISSFDVKYDTNALQDVTDPGDVIGTIKDFQGGVSTDYLNNTPAPGGVNAGFVSYSLDFSAVTGLNNQSTVAIRFDDFSDNDAMSIDNVLVTGVAIPEPSTFVLTLGVALVMLIGFRNRK